MGNEVIRFFERMVYTGIKLNAIIFINFLIGCSYVGLVEEGLNLFNFMESVYGVEFIGEYYVCIIDFFGRVGKFKEVEEFIICMFFELNVFGWCFYLGVCRIYGDKLRVEIVAEKLLKFEFDNSSVYILLFNIYVKES